jgi:hypothetical protein
MPNDLRERSALDCSTTPCRMFALFGGARPQFQ